MKNPSVTLTPYNMGNVTQADLDAWRDYVSVEIDGRCGFAVNVDAFRLDNGPASDRIEGATHEQRETITEAIHGLWDSFCGEEWAKRVPA